MCVPLEGRIGYETRTDTPMNQGRTVKILDNKLQKTSDHTQVFGCLAEAAPLPELHVTGQEQGRAGQLCAVR